MQDIIRFAKEFEIHSVDSKSLKGLKQGDMVVQFVFLEITILLSVKNSL